MQENIYTNGEYLSKNPGWNAEDAHWKAAEINALLKRNNLAVNEVTEVGCGSGEILVQLAKLNPEIGRFNGYDISPQAIAIAETKANEQLKFFNLDYTANEQPKTELLLVIDVIEHVPDFYGFIEKLRHKAGHVVFHVPLDLCCRSLLKPHILLEQRNRSGHIHYFSEEMVWWFLKDKGFEIVDWNYTFPEIDRDKPTSLKAWLKKKLRKISYKVNKNRSVKLWGGYSLMILAK